MIVASIAQLAPGQSVRILWHRRNEQGRFIRFQRDLGKLYGIFEIDGMREELVLAESDLRSEIVSISRVV